jgi:PRTRC genetic system protein A
MNLSDLNIAGAVLATNDVLPPIAAAGFEYVIAAGGLYIRAEDSRMEAMVQVAPATLQGLAGVETYARLKIPRAPASLLYSIEASARRHLPAEQMYQLFWDGDEWVCRAPSQLATPTSVQFAEAGAPVIDLHSHGLMHAFFSQTDDQDEQGLRFYLVIGNLDTRHWSTILARVGVYGHHQYVPVDMLFQCPSGTNSGPFFDLYYTVVDDNGEPTE